MLFYSWPGLSLFSQATLPVSLLLRRFVSIAQLAVWQPVQLAAEQVSVSPAGAGQAEKSQIAIANLQAEQRAAGY